jgi:VanZ family protein
MPKDLDRAAQRFLGWALLLYVLFVSYGSLVPLNFHAMPLAEAWSRYQGASWLDFGVASRTDWAVNFLLLVPMAFLAQAWCGGGAARPGRWLACALPVAVGCALFAASIEFTQLFFPGRTMSPSDVEAQILGSWLGLALQALWGRPVASWLAGWWLAERGLALTQRLLHAYLVGLLLFAVMPLDLTISPVELVHKLHEGRIALVPFADLPPSPVEAAYELASEIVLWLPVGLLWVLSGATVSRAAWRGGAAAAVIELMQLFVYSRTSSSSDVLTAVLGCLLGAWIGRGWRPGERWQGLATVPWRAVTAAWAVLTLALFWYPFDFNVSADWLAPRIAGLVRPPFETYFVSSELRALNEIVRKLLMFLPGGLLWALHLHRMPAWRQPAQRRQGLAWALGLALLVEAGQLALPDKVADLTDAALEAAGAWIGLALGWRLFAPAALAAAKAPAVAPRAPAAPGPSDPVRTQRAAGERRLERDRERDHELASGKPLPWWVDLLVVLAVALMLWVLGRHPAMPYNVRELFLPGAAGAALTAAALAGALWWLFGLPLALLLRWRRRPEHALWLVPGLPVLGLVGAVPLLLAVPQESIDDIVGSPVLGWPWLLETLLRYTALHGGVALALIGAAWFVARIGWRRSHELLGRWWVALALWAWPLHWAIVDQAATDNLTELMRGGGSLEASASLFCGLLGLVIAASALAAACVARSGRWRLVLAAGLAWPLGTWLLWWGSEPMLMKYDKVFSAAQFLLSADRKHYAGGPALVARFAVASLALALIVLLLQWPGWQRLAATLRAGRGTRA